MTRIFFLALFVFCFVALNGGGVLYAKDGVKTGQAIPHDLRLLDQNKKPRKFEDLTGAKGIILVFVRSAEWCPFCQKQLINFNDNAKKFEQEGYNIVSVSYDTAAAMQKFITTNKPVFTMLSDPRSESIRAFGIFNEDAAIGTRSYGIANPHVYIISKDKKIQAQFAEKDYKNRPSIDKILAEVKKLNPPPAPKKYVHPYESLNNMGEDPILPGQDVIEVPDLIEEPLLPPPPEERAVTP